MKKRAWLGLLLLLAGGCATSSNPREGGLIGYWATGESGYQKRLDERQGTLQSTQAETEAESARAGQLETDRNVLREQLQNQRREMAEMQEELDSLRAECEALQSQSDAKEAERLQILGELEHLQQAINELKGDTSMLVQEKQKEIEALQQEVGLLLERYSLLTTL